MAASFNHSSLFLSTALILLVTFTASSQITCDSGNPNSTCFINSAKTALNGEVFSGTGNLVIQSGGSINGSQGQIFTLDIGGNVDIQVGGAINGNAIINAANCTVSGTINVDGKGHSRSNGPGQGADGQCSNYHGGGGAAYGGNGGNGNGNHPGGSAYNSITQPNDFGSGGGNSCGSNGGHGGGRVHIDVIGSVTVSGLITANGNQGTATGNRCGGGGSGGAVWIEAGTIAGSGTIRTIGGIGGQYSGYRGGSGGGGRISLMATTDNFTGPLQAFAGSNGYNRGGAGTIYRHANASLLVDNLNISGTFTPLDLTAGYTFQTVTVNRRGHLNPSGGTQNTTIVNLTNNVNSPITFATSVSNFTCTDISSAALLDFKATANTTLNCSNFTSSSTFNYNSGLLDMNVTNSANFNSGSTVTPSVINSTLDLNAANVTVAAGANINLDGKGFNPSSGTGQGVDGVCSNYHGGGGGAHGGNGGLGNGGYTGGVAYGSVLQPTTLGSGGGNSCGSNGGFGGGAIKFTVSGALDVSGTITANGTSGTATGNRCGGGGAGGSIWITTGSLAGSGTIRANGGNGADYSGYRGGSGGGGRIALIYTTSTFTGARQAFAGTNGYNRGGAGTIYFKAGSANGYVLADNNNINGTYTPLDLSIATTFDSVVVYRRAHLYPQNNPQVTNIIDLVNYPNSSITFHPNVTTFACTNLRSQAQVNFLAGTPITFNNTNVTSSSTITYQSGLLDINTSSSVDLQNGANVTPGIRPSTVDWTCNDFTLQAGGSITYNGMGYPRSTGTGQGADGQCSNYHGGGGGAYGGNGGNGNGSHAGGTAFGSILQPTDFGSGGGNSCGSNGGHGGGAIKIVATNNTTVNGTISANGNAGTATGNRCGGGGSGGSIWITTSTLSGSGTIRANGGNGADYSGYRGGSGDGGRIALIYTNSTFSGARQASAGTNGYNRGGAGTIYFKEGSANGYVLADNNNISGTYTPLDLSVATTFDSVIVTLRAHLYPENNPQVTNIIDLINYPNSPITFNPNVTNFNCTDVRSQAQMNFLAVSPTTFNNTNVTSNSTITYQSALLDINTVNSVVLQNGANVTPGVRPSGLDWTCTHFTMQNGGSVTYDGMGHPRSTGTGQGTDGVCSNYHGGGGGAYGGNGGTGNGNYTGGTAFGSVIQPTDYGSGGGNSCGSNGGHGGGAIKIVATGNTIVDGTISTVGNNGTATGNRCGGGGSGGSIWIQSGTFSGSGLIRANGGNGADYSGFRGGSGGGGRIAIDHGSGTFGGTIQSHAGVNGYNRGGAGTIYIQKGTANRYVLADNNNISGTYTPLDLAISTTLDSVIVTRRAHLYPFGGTQNMVLVDLYNHVNSPVTFAASVTNFTCTDILSNANIMFDATSATTFNCTNYTGTAQLSYRSTMLDLNVSGAMNCNSGCVIIPQILNSQLDVAAGSMTIATGASFNYDGKGYTRTSGPGQGADGQCSNYHGGGGAAFGGNGGNGNGNHLGGTYYGSVYQPVSLGSGGGNSCGSNGGFGGGAVKITVNGVMDVDGTITANGNDGTATGNRCGGGGAGGSIWVSTGTLSGAGIIRSNGGIGGQYSGYRGGSGGGGRIAIYYNSKPFTGTITAFAGVNGYNRGGAGTVYFNEGAGSNQVLIVNNSNISGTITPLDLTVAAALDSVLVDKRGHLQPTGSTQNTSIEAFTNTVNSPVTMHSSTATFEATEINSAAQIIFTNSGTSTLNCTGFVGSSTLTASAQQFNVNVYANTTMNAGCAVVPQVIQSKLNWTTSNLIMNSSSTINYTSAGYNRSSGPGQGADGQCSNYHGGGGAGYGGNGGTGNGSHAGGGSYGSQSQPVDFGSGGGNSCGSNGGFGGGVIKLVVNNSCFIDGIITTDGTNGTATGNRCGGGGGGGSIWIESTTLSGSGTIRSNGGNGGQYSGYRGGGGAGGRISLCTPSGGSFSGTVEVNGGIGYQNGDLGTINYGSTCAAIFSLTITPTDASCNGVCDGEAAVSVSGGTAPYTYQWNDPSNQTTATATGLCAGTFGVTVEDSDGFINAGTITISEPTAPSSTASVTHATCAGGSNDGAIDLTPQGVTPFTYAWSNGANTEDISGLTAATYTVTFTDNNGCSATDDYTINLQGGLPNVNFTVNDQNITPGSSVNFTDLSSNSPTSWSWSFPGGSPTSSTLQNPTNVTYNTTGTFDVILVATNGCGSDTLTQFAYINVGLLTQADFSASSTTICAGDVIDFTDLSQNTPTSWVWNVTPGTINFVNSSSVSQNPSIQFLAGGSYEVELIASNAFGSDTETKPNYISVDALPTSSVSVTHPSCSGGSNNGSIDLTPSGAAPFTYGWDVNNPDGNLFTITVANKTPAHPYFGTGSSLAYSLNGEEGKELTLVRGITYAFVTSGVSASHPFYISSNPAGAGAGVISDGVINNFITGTGQTLYFTPNSSHANLLYYQCNSHLNMGWKINIIDGLNQQDLSGLSNGAYFVVVTDNNGCSSTNNAILNNVPPLAGYIVGADVCTPGGNDGAADLILTSGSAPYTYSWSNGANTEDISNLTIGTYTVTVGDNLGCTFTDNVTIGIGTFTWTGAVSSDWNTPGNWSCNGVPGPTDDVVIPNVSPNFFPVIGNFDAFARDLTIHPGATLTYATTGSYNFGIYGGCVVNGSFTQTGNRYVRFFGNGNTISGTGTVLVDVEFTSGSSYSLGSNIAARNVLFSGGTLDVTSSNYTIYVYGNWTFTSGSFVQHTGTVQFTGGATKIVNAGSMVFHHIYIDGGMVQLSTNPLMAYGSITTAIGATFNSNSIDVEVRGNWINAGTYTPGTSTVIFNGNSPQTIDIGSSPIYNLYVACISPSGTVTAVGNTLRVTNNVNIIPLGTLFAGGNDIEVGGNWTNAGTFTSDTSTVIFNGSGIQTISMGASVFYNTTFNGTGTVNIVSNYGPFNNTFFINGSLNIASGATLNFNNYDIQINGDWINNGTFIPGTRTVIFNGTGTQQVNLGTSAFWNLDINSASCLMQIVGGALDIDNNINVVSGGTIDLNNFDVKIGGNWQNNGNIVIGNSSVFFDGTSTQTVVNDSAFVNVTINGVGNTVILNSNITILGNLTIGSTSTLNVGVYNIRVSGNWVNNGTFLSGTGTVYFVGNGVVQTVNAGGFAFNNFVVDCDTSGTKVNVVDNPLLVDGSITIESGDTLNSNNYNIIVGLHFTNNGVFIANNDSVFFNGNQVQTINIGSSRFYHVVLNCGCASSTVQVTGNPLYIDGSLVIFGNNILQANGFDIYVGGNWTNFGVFQPGTSTVYFNGTGTQLINRGVSPFYHINLDCAGCGTQVVRVMNTHLDVNGDVYIASGARLNSNNYNINCGGNWTNFGTFVANTDTVFFDGSATYNINGGPSEFHHVIINGGTYNCNGTALRMLGSLVINNGFTLASNGQRIEVFQDFLNNGTFSAGTDTVVFDGDTLQLVDIGTSSFFNCLIDGSTGQIVRVINNSWVCGGFIHIKAGSTFDFANYDVTLAGNWTNFGTFLPGSRLVTCNGSGTQLIRCGSSQFYDLSFNSCSCSSNIGQLTGTKLLVDRHIFIASGHTLRSNGNSIYVGGNFTNAGTFIPDTDTVKFTGSGAQTVDIGSSSFYHASVDCGCPSNSLNVTNNSLDCDGSLIIASTAGLNPGGLDVYIGGDCVNYGSFPTANIGVHFDGISAQRIVGLPATFYDLIINNSGLGVTLEVPTSVTNSLTLTDGVVYTTPVNLLTLIDNATSTQGTVTSYVDGPMKKIGDDAFIFPVGAGGVCGHFGISAPGAVNNEVVLRYYGVGQTLGSALASPLNYLSTCGYWTMDQPVGNSNLTIQLYWTGGACGITPIGNTRVALWDAGNSWWGDCGNSATSGSVSSAGSVTSSSQHDSGSFTLGSDICVPGSWTGTISTDWFTVGNWGCASSIPTSTTNVVIPDVSGASGNFPEITVIGGLTGECRDININSNALITVFNGAQLDVYGDFVNAGSANIGAGKVKFTGSAAQTLNGSSTFGILELDNSSGLTNIGGTQTILNSLELVTGQFATNEALVINSDISGTGFIDDFSIGRTGTLDGDITMERHIASGANGFHNIGSGVNNPNITEWAELNLSGPNNGQIIPLPTCDPSVISANSPYGKVFEWREPGPFTVPGCDQSGWHVRSAGSLVDGRGYSAIVSNGTVIDVQGTANTGTVTYPGLTNSNTEGDGYHLVSVPYPSAIEWNQPPGFDAQAHLWMSSGGFSGTYQTILGGTGADLPSSQGFFVRVSTPFSTPNFTLNNSDRRRGDPAFTRMTGNHWYDQLLTLVIEGNGFADKTQVYFKDGASNLWDGQMDAHKMKSNHDQPTLYTRIPGDHHLIGINGLPLLDHAHSVDMGLLPGTDGSYNVRAEDVEGFDASALIFLEDKQTGDIINLRSTPQYTFTANVLDDTERFIIHFVPPVQIEAISMDCDGAKGTILLELWQTSIDGQSILWDDLTIEDSEGNLVHQVLEVNGPISVNGLNAGLYTVSLNINGYVAEQTIAINPIQQVVADFAPSTNLAGMDETIQFANNGDYGLEYRWEFGDGTISDESDPTHSYTMPGTYQVTLLSFNKDCQDIATDWIEVSETTTGVAEDSEESQINLWLSGQVLNLDLISNDQSPCDLEIFNSLGQLLFSQKGLSNGKHQINLPPWADQVLLVKLYKNGKLTNHQLVGMDLSIK